MDAVSSWTARIGRVVSPAGDTASKQLYFAAIMLGYTVLISLSHVEMVLTGQFLAALGVLLVATALAVVIRWEELRPLWGALVPVLDMVAVALVRDLMRESSMAVSLLVLIPVLWMAARLRMTGVSIAVLAVTVLIAAPSLARADAIDSLTITHSLLLPFIVLQVGMLVVGALKLLDGQHRKLTSALEEKAALLEAAATSEQLLKNVIDSVGVGIVVVDRDGHDVLMNSAQQRIHQISSPEGNDDPNEAELTLRYPGTTTPLPPDQRPVRRAVLQETYSNYLVSVGPAGVAGTTFAASARQILDRRGERDSAVVVFSDVSSYIEMVRSQQRFVAAVSHELRTPLTSVIGYLEMAQDTPELPPKAASYLEVAHRNAEQLLLIAQDLLADQVARSGTQKLTLRPHRLSAIAEQVVEDFALRAEQEGITVVQDVEQTPELSLDAPRLQQAVGNLLSNALKYTPAGGTVRVQTRVRQNEVELCVTDTGIGMSDQEQANLFTDYYRTETARDRHIPGHGIGLSLTRRLVVAHGGQISVRSRPGEGSTFTLRFAQRPEGGADGTA